MLTFGDAERGQLGHGDVAQGEKRWIPTMVKAMEFFRVAAVACGANFTLAQSGAPHCCCNRPLTLCVQRVVSCTPGERVAVAS